MYWFTQFWKLKTQDHNVGKTSSFRGLFQNRIYLMPPPWRLVVAGSVGTVQHIAASPTSAFISTRHLLQTCLSQPTWTAVTKHRRRGSLQTTGMHFSQFRRLQVQDRGARLVRFWLQMADILLCSHTVGRGRGLCGAAFIEAIIPPMGALHASPPPRDPLLLLSP